VALIGVAVAGLGASICAPTVFSLTGRLADPAGRGAAMGNVTTLAYIGFVFGPALVGIAASSIGLRLALGLVGVVAVLLGVLARRAPVPVTLADQ
jgi:MFS family permease